MSLDWNVLNWIQENLQCDFLDVFMSKFTLLGEMGIIWIAIAIGLSLIHIYLRQNFSWFRIHKPSDKWKSINLSLIHIYSGYDLVNDLSGTFEKFDKVIGTDQIAVFHINDSKNPCGAAKDRHENIGFGNIGFETLKEIVYMKEFENIPKILETPYIKDPDNDKKSYAPYKFEIEMLKQRELNPNLQKEVIENE